MIDKSKREDGIFSREDFSFDEERDIYICPAGKILTTTGTVVNDDQSYTEPESATASMPAQNAMLPERAGTKGSAQHHEEARDVAGRAPRPKPTSDRAVIAKRSRCCLPTSSASCVLIGCVYGARAARSSSSRWQRSHRT